MREKEGRNEFTQSDPFSFELSLASIYIGQDNGICTRWRLIVIGYTNDDSMVVIAMSRTRWTRFSRDAIVRLEYVARNKNYRTYRLFLDASTGSRSESEKTECSLRDRELPFALLHDGETIPYLQIGWHFVRFGEYISGGGNAIDSDAWSTERISSANADRTRILERSFACFRLSELFV